MESIEVRSEVICPFLLFFKGDMTKAQEEIKYELFSSKLVEVNGERFLTYNLNNYHVTGENSWEIDDIIFGNVVGKKLKYKKKNIKITRRDRLIALGYLSLSNSPHYDTRYFNDNVDKSLYSLAYKDNHKRWILERWKLDDRYILKTDLIKNNIYHIGFEVKTKFGGECTMGRKSFTGFNNFLIENNFGEISAEHNDILIDMVSALLALTGKELTR